MAVLGWLVEVCLDDGDPITRQIPSSPGNKFYSLIQCVTLLSQADRVQVHWWNIFFQQRYDIFYHLVDGKKILKEERRSTQYPNCPSCSLCPSKGKTAASGPSLGFVVLTYFTFLRFCGCCLYNVSACENLQWNVCLVGDGWSRGASLSHTAAGVLRRGVKLVGGLGGRESQNSRPNHQTFQIFGLSGSAMVPFCAQKGFRSIMKAI